MSQQSSSKNVLVINCGSDSIKFQIINMQEKRNIFHGSIGRVGKDDAIIKFKNNLTEESINQVQSIKNHHQGLKIIFSSIPQNCQISVVGHRIVHGGPFFKNAVILDDDVIKKIEECTPLAPLHNPIGLVGIKESMQLLPSVKHVASFDTAFHQNKSEEDYLYSFPSSIFEKYKIRKYGFHGASHKYVAHRAADLLHKKITDLKLITCHLGNGSTITAVENGVAIDTSTTFGTACGMPMGTRSGDFDPTIILHLIDNCKMSTKEVHQLLYKESGLLGVSALSNDMREIRKAATEGNSKAKLARKLYIQSAIKFIGSFLARMRGADAIIFAAGIGENDWELREEIANSFNWCGVEVDVEKNRGESNSDVIFSKVNSKIKLLVIPTNEEMMIAADALEALDIKITNNIS
ncbi:MAG: acetate kinase [Oligoflexia bacterium]|nr:acetate kinase [Oligoflexia bacterium]